MAKWIADYFLEAFLNPVDDKYMGTAELLESYPPFKPREVKNQLLKWWNEYGWKSTKIIKEMSVNSNGWFYCMTPSTVERWKLVIIAHDRRFWINEMSNKMFMIDQKNRPAKRPAPTWIWVVACLWVVAVVIVEANK